MVTRRSLSTYEAVMTTKSMISAWFDEGVRDERTHMIVVCDTFDHEDYPVYASSDADCLDKHDQHNGRNMQRVMEVYDLRMDKQRQLAEFRANHLPSRG